MLQKRAFWGDADRRTSPADKRELHVMQSKAGRIPLFSLAETGVVQIRKREPVRIAMPGHQLRGTFADALGTRGITPLPLI